MGRRNVTGKMLRIGGFFFLFFSVSRGFGAEDTPDTVAKYLAGLMVPAASADAPQQLSGPDPQSAQVRPALPTATSSPIAIRVRRPGSLIAVRRYLPAPTDRGSATPRPASSTSRSTAQPANNPWLTHSTELDQAWKRTEQQQLANIATWAPQVLDGAYQADTTVFYMFSGPDFLYAHAFFPNARTYIFCGNEPVGTPPDLDKIAPQALPYALANIRKSLESVLNWSFFITKEMKTDLTRTDLSGTVPLLYVFLARMRCAIESVTPVTIDREGNLSEGNASEQTPGIRIVFTNGSPSPQTLYYFCSDLSDDGVKSNPAFLRFCEKQGRGVSLLKAASYLMHEPGFSKVREFLLEHSSLILQDDSGIPLRFLAEKGWNVRYCGQYVGPIEIFKQHWQPDLADNYARQVPSPLSFGFGYQWQPDRSDVMIATPPGIREVASGE